MNIHYDYLYADNKELKKNKKSGLNEEYFTVFKIKNINDFDTSQRKAITIANSLGIKLAGGSFTSNCLPYNFDSNYKVIEVPDNTIIYADPPKPTVVRNPFYLKVDKRSRVKMIEFLANHFRYDTMSSWNGMTSYAHNVKLHNIPNVPDAAYMLIYEDLTGDYIRDIIREWEEEQDFTYQVGFNGRSGGYMVLYSGGSRNSQYKSHCTECSQKNYTTVEDTGNICGACGEPERINCTLKEVFTSMTSIDDNDEDYFDGWELYELQERVELVQSFDKLCDDVVESFLDLCENFSIIDGELVEIDRA